MISIIYELVELVETGKVPVSLAQIDGSIGSQELRVVAIKVLGWLKSRARFPNDRPFNLYDSFGWCANLRVLVASSDELSSTFQIDGNVLNFAPTVTPLERREIEKFVDQHYRPPLMT